jgi:hypothetical protein
MSLEAAIEKLTEALNSTTVLLQAMADRAAANGATKPAVVSVAPVEPTVNSPVAPISEKRKPGRPPKKPVITEEQVRTAFGGYLSAIKEKTVREQRKANVAEILKHFGVERATEIPEEGRAEALGYVAKLESGETLDFSDDDAEADADDDDTDAEDAMI